MLGAGAMTNSIPEIRDADFLFVIGSNTTEAHPVIALEMKRAVRRGARLVVADPRRIWLTEIADQHLQLAPGTDVWLLNAMAHVIVEEGLVDREFIDRHTQDFERVREVVMRYSPEEAERVTGVPAAEIRKAAVAYATTRKAGIYYTLGITEHTHGTDNVYALANLVLMTGHLGIRSAGLNPLRGQNNVQGANDAGASPIFLPGYQHVTDPEARAKFEAAWDVKLPSEPGRNLNQMVKAMVAGEVKGLFVMGEDLAVSEPNVSRLDEALGKCEMLVCQDILPTETMRYAHVVLPGACFAEKKILCDLARAAGYAMPHYHGPAEIYDEMASLSPRFAGISHARIDAEGGLQWPCPDPEHPGTPTLHEDGPIRGKAMFQPVEYRPSEEVADDEYPLLLSTGRTLYQYNAATQTRRDTGTVAKNPSAFLEMHAEDAARIGVDSGAWVIVSSRRGQVAVEVLVSDRMQQGCVWMPMHFAEARANLVTNDAGDAVTGTPEYKVCAVRVEPES